MTALAGLAAAALLWWLLKLYGRSTPAQVRAFARQAGGWAALGGAALLALRGRLDMAALLGGAGAWLLGWGALPPPFGSRPAALPAIARMRSSLLEAEVDRITGRVDGLVLAGAFAGRRLASLSRDELLRLRDEASDRDVDGARLVEAHLDGRFPAWREHAQPHDHARGRAEPQGGAMTEQEAHQILGLQPGAGPDEIRRAHRELMKRLHPDGGGSTFLASRVNGAKDVLLDRHR